MRTPLGPARAEMFTTAYWTGDDNRHQEADRLLMDAAAIRNFNTAVLADPAFCRVDICRMTLPDRETRDAFVTYNLTRSAYTEAAPLVRDNILNGLSDFGKDYGAGVCIARSVLLGVPIEGDWPASKPYTLSPIHVNEGVIIYSETADKKWYFVRTAIYYGWVSSRCIALCDSREEMISHTAYENFIVVTADHLTVTVEGGSEASNGVCGTENRADEVSITYDMGDRIRLTAHDAQGYHVTVLIKDGKGHAAEASAIIAESADVRIGYLPYTQKNLLDQCFKTLDDRYMWGGGEGERDCSSWVMEIFSCFGFVFPRNSARQAKLPAPSLDLSGLDNERKSEILSQLPAGTLIFSPGHVMVYLGRRGNDNYMIHNGGDFCVITDTCDSIESGTQPAVVKYLTYGVTVMSLEKTTTLKGRVWLDAITCAVFPQNSDSYGVFVNQTHER